MNINIEYKIKPYFTKDTLMSFLCKDINYIDADKAKSYVEGYLSKIPVQILNVFDSENWKIIITNEDLKEKFGFTYDIYGVTDYDAKTIYTYASEDAIQYGLGHEIGHFVDMYMGDLSQTLEWDKLV